jgi:Erv1 / Alr family
MSRRTRKIHSTPTPYEDKDYSSNDGMLTTVWGPGIWHYLHTMSFNYPVHPTAADKRHYRNFVLELQYVLPCGKCRKNLVKNFKKHPLNISEMKSRETFSRYIYELHETVNRMLGKKSGLTYDKVRERYEHFRARCAKPLTKLRVCKTPSNRTRKTDKGCVVPLYGNKAKCVLQIVPQDVKCETMQIDQRCVKRRESDFEENHK